MCVYIGESKGSIRGAFPKAEFVVISKHFRSLMDIIVIGHVSFTLEINERKYFKEILLAWSFIKRDISKMFVDDLLQKNST